MNINIGIAIEKTLYDQLVLNFRTDDNDEPVVNSLSPEDRNLLKNVHSGFWKEVTNPLTGIIYNIVSFNIDKIITVSQSASNRETYDASSDDGKIEVIERLMSYYNQGTIEGSRNIAICGAWDMSQDGIQYGQTRIPPKYDLDGNLTDPEEVTGTPIYPIHPLILMAMPDDVVYDGEGKEISRTKAAFPKEVHTNYKIKRRWT